MPTYEYVCRDCGHRFDIVQSMQDEPLTMCPECGGSLRKVFAPPAISFKGSGFYATDHGKRAPQDAKADEKAGTTTDTAKKDAKDGKAEGAKAKPAKASEAPSKKEPAAS